MWLKAGLDAEGEWSEISILLHQYMCRRMWSWGVGLRTRAIAVVSHRVLHGLRMEKALVDRNAELEQYKRNC